MRSGFKHVPRRTLRRAPSLESNKPVKGGDLQPVGSSTTPTSTGQDVHKAFGLTLFKRAASRSRQSSSPASRAMKARKVDVVKDTQTGIPFGMPKGARCVQRLDDSLTICNSHYLSHFAAFFIDARAKRSVVESCIPSYFYPCSSST